MNRKPPAVEFDVMTMTRTISSGDGYAYTVPDHDGSTGIQYRFAVTCWINPEGPPLSKAWRSHGHRRGKVGVVKWCCTMAEAQTFRDTFKKRHQGDLPWPLTVLAKVDLVKSP